MREWPVPKRWTKPPAPIASAQTSLARSMASPCVSRIFSRTAIPASIQPSGTVSALGIYVDRLPVPAPHRLVGRIEHRVHDVTVDEVLARLLPFDEAVDEVAHLFVIPIDPRFVRDRKHPTDVGVRLLHQVAGRLLDESPNPSGARVGDDAAHRAVHLVAQLHPAFCGPGCFGQRRSEEHTSELQSQSNLVCRLLLEKKKKHKTDYQQQFTHPEVLKDCSPTTRLHLWYTIYPTA